MDDSRDQQDHQEGHHRQDVLDVLDVLEAHPETWSCRERVEHILAGERVESHAANVARDVCDDGHVHTDVVLGLLTATRFVHVLAGDSHHLTEEDAPALQCLITSLPLRAIHEVQVLCRNLDDMAATEVRIQHASGHWQAVGGMQDCADPECDCVSGSIWLEGRNCGVVLSASGRAAAEMAAFGGHLARLSAQGGAQPTQA